MPSFDDSPMTRLVGQIDASPRPESLRGQWDVSDVRSWIYQAASDELTYKRRLGRAYDPAGDARFQWLLEWAEILEGTRRRFTPNLEASMRFIFMPVESLLCPRDLAAGERRAQPLTLAQGS